MIIVKLLSYENAVKVVDFVNTNTKMTAQLGQWEVYIDDYNFKDGINGLLKFVKSLDVNYSISISNEEYDKMIAYSYRSLENIHEIEFYQNSASTVVSV